MLNWSGPKEFMIHCDCVGSFYNVQRILDVELRPYSKNSTNRLILKYLLYQNPT